MRVVIVANPVSGRGRARNRAAVLAALLEARGHEPVLVASEPRDASEWLSSCLGGADVVAAVGGDGTVRSMASVLAAAGVPLVHVPQGNENLFARSQGMGRRLTDTIALIENGEPHRIDMAEANGSAMLLMASIGFDAEVVADVAARRRDRVSNWRYLRAAFGTLRRWTPPELTVSVDGDQIVSARPGWVVVSNAREYGGRLDPAPMAVMDDRRLDVTFFPASSATQIVRWLIRCRMGWQVGAAGFVHRTAGSEVEIRSPDPVRWQLDGDPPPAGGPEAVQGLRVRLASRQLTVLRAPARAAAGVSVPAPSRNPASLQ
ncbi:MAG: diacylglycerol kinase family protein [Phycisphaerales bacterium]|jgi:diacylglycerol kinase family enzyme|nr:diacylglycerol kinase family protein [Phycisphaerales bacterium]